MRFLWGERTYLMGIVNVTPDSFSGDGRLQTSAASAHAQALHAAGADVLDLGAESTRPGALGIDADEECRRLLPVVRAVREALPAAVLSVDTTKPAVLAAAHAAGCDWLNSVWGLGGEAGDPPAERRESADALTAYAAERRLPVVIMHNKRVAAYDGDVVDAVLRYLDAQAARAVRAGIPPQAVILDPGIGFGKTADHNLAVLAALDRLVALGFPTLVGTSRKSTLGRLTGRAVDERAYATAATVALAVAANVDIVRVHDVAAMRDVARVADAVVRGWRPEAWNLERAPAGSDG
ncbi:MAG: dihydropteroate synthase [Candidatus Eremiobacteraeota bacterium]|nr:dihydropteroate synthase [Candidatus Eremiobacteraeota bacterium]MBC5802008.1 dihydropteroate synthase [Candidatus Eremiobacteraeota bacterium]MBC5820398.1 dihydropteroate synthase [Candidatus Eremiobacteraeota bacterium]